MQLSADVAKNVVVASKGLGYDSVPQPWIELLRKGWKIYGPPESYSGCLTATCVWYDPHGFLAGCVCHTIPENQT